MSAITGPYAPLGSVNKAAAQLEVDQINAAGGVLGRQIKLTALDDKTDVTQSVTNFNQLASNKSTSVILSSVFATASAASGASALAAKVPTLTLSPIETFENGSNKYAFTIPAGAAPNNELLFDYLKSVGITSLAVGYTTPDSFGDATNKALLAYAKKSGVKILLDEGIDPTGTDFSPLITHVKQSGADAFFVIAAGAAPVIIAKQLEGSGVRIIMTGADASPLFTQPAGTAAEGIVMGSTAAVASAAIPSGEFKSTIDSFITAWKAKNSGQYPPQFAFDAATGIQLAVAAIKKAGSTDRAKVRDALESLDALTVDGRYSYSPTNHMGLTKQYLAIVVVKSGELVATPFTEKQFASNPPK